METKLVRVTPKLALFYLLSNRTNRPMRKAWITRLANIIKAGEWEVTHQGIAFDVNGNLQDGQHRLHAIIEAGVAVDMFVTTGASLKAFTAIDQGVKRSTSDILRVPPVVAAVVNRIGTMIASQKKPSTALLEKTNEVFGQTIAEIYEIAPSNIRVYASTNMRIAAAARLYNGADRDYIFKVYKAMATVNIEEMPAIAKSFVSQVSRGEVNTAGGTNYDYLARCWLIFDKARADQSKLVVRNAIVINQEMTDTFKREFERHYTL